MLYKKRILNHFYFEGENICKFLTLKHCVLQFLSQDNYLRYFHYRFNMYLSSISKIQEKHVLLRENKRLRRIIIACHTLVSDKCILVD